MTAIPLKPEPATDQRPGAKFVYPSQARPLAGYTLERGIGMGGFGEIYLATSDAGKHVALKLIQRHLDVELRGIRQCLNLKHPNLVDLYDVRQDEQGNWWVVMEYVAGQNLEQALATCPNGMSVPQTLAWIHGLGAGVAYLHERGIVHRDLKPANIFCEQNIVKVGDYGLSKYIACSRRSGHTESIGTVHYMAPEVANGRYGKEIDIYALGVMLYEMLTGRVPFDGESIGEVLMKHLTATPDVSMLAEPYRGVVARALEKDPAKRFASVAEMLAQLPPPERPGPGAFIPVAVAAAVAPLPAIVAAPAGRPAGEEPIWWAVRQGFAWLARTFDEAMGGIPAEKKAKKKIVLVVAAVALLVVFAEKLSGPLERALPDILAVLALYFVYRLLRALVLVCMPSPNEPAPPHAVSPQPARPAAPTPPRKFDRWAQRHGQEQPLPALIVKSTRQQAAELAGSLLLASLIAIIVSAATVVVWSHLHHIPPEPVTLVWLAMASIAGAWAVLIPAKFWEGTRGEQALRRLVSMVMGLAVGLFAWGVAEALLLELHVDGLAHDRLVFRALRPWSSEIGEGFHAADGKPLLLAYLVAFGTLFFLLRWWRQADPLRRHRLKIGSTVVSVLVACLVAAIWRFPQPWLPMTAGVVSLAVQLASPWAPGRKG